MTFQSDDDQSVCTLDVPPITERSYGTYTATVSNIAGPLFVSFLLKPYGRLCWFILKFYIWSLVCYQQHEVFFDMWLCNKIGHKNAAA